mgnify:CR=1 FL=1
MKIVVVSGGFDPVHSGHIRLFNAARTYGDYLIVGLNSDGWLQRKKGREFMPFNERAGIVMNLKAVDEVMSFDDSDGSACDLLHKIRGHYWTKATEFIFANGGDRNESNNAEKEVEGYRFVYGVGGSHKKNSSSWLLRAWNE